jgi:hypothetical protein
MTAYRKRSLVDWVTEDLRVGGPRPPLTLWEAYRVPVCAAAVVVGFLVVVWLLEHAA